METPAAAVEEAKAVKPAVKKTRKPAAEKVEEAVSEVGNKRKTYYEENQSGIGDGET